MSNFEKTPKFEKLLNFESFLLFFVVFLIMFTGYLGYLGYLENKREMRKAYLQCVTTNGPSTIEACEKLLK